MAGERIFRGEVLPELKKDVLRLYSNRFCPFAQRTRLVLLHKNIPFETINVDLSNKPDWLFEKNPLGLVPLLERNDEIILESLYCNEWLEENFHGGGLTAANRVDHYRWKNIAVIYETKVKQPFYDTMLGKDEESRKAAKEKLQAGLSWTEKQLGDRVYFAGGEVGYIDYNLYPWAERIPSFSEYNVPKFEAWVNRMQQLPTVKEMMRSKEAHTEFYGMYLAAKSAGTHVDWDYDLPPADN